MGRFRPPRSRLELDMGLCGDDNGGGQPFLQLHMQGDFPTFCLLVNREAVVYPFGDG